MKKSKYAKPPKWMQNITLSCGCTTRDGKYTLCPFHSQLTEEWEDSDGAYYCTTHHLKNCLECFDQ